MTQLLETTTHWHVLHTKSRQEKALALTLGARGIKHYLPLVSRVRYHGRRKLKSELPLFPGYVFLWGTLEDAYFADRTKRVARIIPVVDQRRLDWEIKNVRLALSREALLRAHPYLKEGMRVEVSAGPFRGLQGLIQRRVRNDRLVLQVNTFGKAVALEIDESLLVPVD